MESFQSLLAKIAERLKAKNIPYMIIGGQAVLLYGEPRLTRDIDVTLGADTDRLREILEVAKSLFFEAFQRNVEEFVRETMVLPVRDPHSGIRIDFIFSFTPYERQAIRRAHKVAIGGSLVTFAAVEDVIIHKLLAGRPRDVEDVRSILKRNKVNNPYLTKWLKEFSEVVQRDLLQEYQRIAP
jgi:predicted nucleotidyltransferase